jgi:type II secretory pathway pseudopilin PulG
MKLNTYSKRKAGMTLLELTVVILVLLSLISILFIGARAWKRGADRSANILNIRNVQQAVRGHANMRNLVTPESDGVGGFSTGSPLASTDILSDDGTDAYMKTPTPPAGLDPYTYGDAVPAIGSLYVTNHFDHEIYGWGDLSTVDPEDLPYSDW